MRERLEIALVEPHARVAPARDGEELGRRVHSGDVRAARGRELEEPAGAAAYVEQARAGADLAAAEDRFVQRSDRALLRPRPVLRARSPQ